MIHFRKALTSLAVVACLLVVRAGARADTFTLTCEFDGTIDQTLTAPFVGDGSFSYDAPAPLADGSYAWTSFSNIALQLTVQGFTFAQTDLTTTAADVNIGIRGGYFFFSNLNGAGDGAQGGSADFSNSGNYLTTQPYDPSSGPLGGGNPDAPLYHVNIAGTDIGGNYGAVPEPTTFACMIAGAAMCGVFIRRKKSARI